MKDQICKYIESKKGAWSEATLNTTKHSLLSWYEVITGDPVLLFENLRDLKPYSVVTTWTRVVGFWDWHSPNSNPYRTYRTQNKQVFKSQYFPKQIKLSFSEIRTRVSLIQDTEVRTKAEELLYSGMRYSESFTISAEGVVKGKGGKYRKIFLPPGFPKTSPTSLSYQKVYRELKQVGLTPHMLRKAAATRFAGAGMKEADLLKVMGWNSMETAKFYLQPKQDNELSSIISGSYNGK